MHPFERITRHTGTIYPGLAHQGSSNIGHGPTQVRRSCTINSLRLKRPPCGADCTTSSSKSVSFRALSHTVPRLGTCSLRALRFVGVCRCVAHHRPYWNGLCGGKARSALWSSWVALRCRTITPLSTIAYDPKQTSNPISRSARVVRSSHAMVLDGSLG